MRQLHMPNPGRASTLGEFLPVMCLAQAHEVAGEFRNRWAMAHARASLNITSRYRPFNAYSPDEITFADVRIAGLGCQEDYGSRTAFCS